MIEQGAGDGGKEADDGGMAVCHTAPCEEAEGEEAEQRAVGVARHGVDDIDGAATAQQTEREDGDDERHDDGHVDPSAQADVRGAAEDVDAERGGQRGDGGVGTGKGGGHDAEDEGNDDEGAQASRGYELREKVVATLREGKLLRRAEHMEQNAEPEEEGIDGQERHAIEAHIFLGIAERGAREVFLHHVLIQPRHDNDDEHSAQELPPEILRRGGIPHEDVGEGMADNGCPCLWNTHAEAADDGDDDAGEGEKQAERLEGISADDGCHACLTGVEPYQQQDGDDDDGEGYAAGRTDEGEDDDADDIEAGGSPGELAEEEEEGSHAVGALAEPTGQIAVDAGEAKAIIDGEEHEGHDEIAGNEAHAHLQIAHACRPHPSGHGDHRHARQTGTNHAEGYQGPGGAACGAEENIIGIIACLYDGTTGCHAEQQEIACQHGEDKEEGGHGGGDFGR